MGLACVNGAGERIIEHYSTSVVYLPYGIQLVMIFWRTFDHVENEPQQTLPVKISTVPPYVCTCYVHTKNVG